MVEIGHFPSWPRIEIRSPCISSSQTPCTVPAVPSVRITALPTSSAWAFSNSLRIVDARTFAAGMARCLPLKGAEVVTDARQSDVGGALERYRSDSVGNRSAAHALSRLGRASHGTRAAQIVQLRWLRLKRAQQFDRRVAYRRRLISASPSSAMARDRRPPCGLRRCRR